MISSLVLGRCGRQFRVIISLSLGSLSVIISLSLGSLTHPKRVQSFVARRYGLVEAVVAQGEQSQGPRRDAWQRAR